MKYGPISKQPIYTSHFPLNYPHPATLTSKKSFKGASLFIKIQKLHLELKKFQSTDQNDFNKIEFPNQIIKLEQNTKQNKTKSSMRRVQAMF